MKIASAVPTATNSMPFSCDARMPNFFILGTTKAGTTSLYQYLSKHPDIYLSETKEPQFFCNEQLYKKGLNYYLDTFFKGSEQFLARGDATPHYLYYEKVARRLAEVLPRKNQRFIVILRDPVERAYSLYWNMVSEGLEHLSFEDALTAEKVRSEDPILGQSCSISCQYIDSGKYAYQIRNYLKYFDIEQFMFLFLEDLQSDRDMVLQKLYRFLGVRSDIRIRDDTMFNKASLPRSRVIHNLIRKPNYLKRLLGRLLPQRLKYRITAKVLDLNKRPVKYPPMDPTLADRMRHEFQDDILDLQKLTRRSLHDWLPI